MSKRMNWFRLYSEIRRDPKIRRLTPEERWLWVAVLCIASDSPKRGYLLISDDFPYEAVDIADEAALPVDVTEKGLDKLIRFGLLERDENGTYYVPKWDERQYDNPSDTPEATRERKRRSRERKKSEQDASRVSHDNVTSNENDASRQCHEQVTRCHESSKINGFNESAGGQSGNVDVSGDLNNKDLDLHDLHVIPLDPDQELIKNNILSSRTKRKPKIYTEDNTYYKMAKYFYDRVTAVARELGLEHLTIKANLQSWADDMRKMVEIDGVDKRLAKEVMDWVTTDPFWQRNVLSAKKLREKFSELAIKMRADKQAQKHKVVPINRRKEKDEERIDKEIAWRNKEIAFQKWVMAGNDPNAFDWS